QDTSVGSELSPDDRRRWPQVFDKMGRKVRRMLGDKQAEALEELERAVTRQVPQEAIAAVGHCRVTAFTEGLPYTFVRTDTSDWSKKPIGHVVLDADLILLNEFCNRGSLEPLVAFNLVVDSGYFQDSETDDVARSLTERPSYSIVLREDSNMSLLV